jgi:hypothetical protein
MPTRKTVVTDFGRPRQLRRAAMEETKHEDFGSAPAGAGVGIS